MSIYGMMSLKNNNRAPFSISKSLFARDFEILLIIYNSAKPS